MRRLIFTNGQSGVDQLTRCGIEGEIYSWDDVLHDGPVPGGYPLAVLSELRARFIASLGWGEYEAVLERFRSRDRQLNKAGDYEELILCFEYDLYDQLQLLQLIYLVANELDAVPEVSIVNPPTYISHCTEDELIESFHNRIKLNEAHMALAEESWHAFTAESPETLEALILAGPQNLPHLHSALCRLAEEYPLTGSGLSRSEWQILLELNQDSLKFGQLFRKCQDREEAIFMGDLSFMKRLQVMSEGDNPLVKVFLEDRPLSDFQHTVPEQVSKMLIDITDAGKSILAGKADRAEFLNLDRWIGGVHLSPANNWHWDTSQKRFIR